jgi:hypothetical protein
MKRLLAILAATSTLSIVPVASADNGTPASGTPASAGACNMLLASSQTHMMLGSANGTGAGAENMAQLLFDVSGTSFCG